MITGEPPIVAANIAPALDCIGAGIARQATKEQRQRALCAMYAMGLDYAELAHAALELLYLLENDPDDSARIDRAVQDVRRRVNFSAGIMRELGTGT